jgi:hypothetical protein
MTLLAVSSPTNERLEIEGSTDRYGPGAIIVLGIGRVPSPVLNCPEILLTRGVAFSQWMVTVVIRHPGPSVHIHHVGVVEEISHIHKQTEVESSHADVFINPEVDSLC